MPWYSLYVGFPNVGVPSNFNSGRVQLQVPLRYSSLWNGIALIVTSTSKKLADQLQIELKPPTTGNAWVRTQHCSYWSPGATAPGHQYLQYWPNNHCMGPVSYGNSIIMANSIRKWNSILKKKISSYLRIIPYIGVLSVSEKTML